MTSTTKPEAQPTRRPSRADVRAAIVEAAAAEFTSYGYTDTTVAAIAARAGFTKGAAYSNFGGKPELFAAACTRRFATITDVLGPAAVRSLQRADAHTSTEIAAQLAEETVSWASWHFTLNEFRALARRDPEIATIYAQVRDTQRQAVAELLRHSRVTLRCQAETGEDDAYFVAATLLVGVIGQLSMEHAISPQSTPRSLMITCLARLIDGLLP